MCDEEDRHSSLKLVNGVCELLGCALVKVRRRFVEDEHTRALEDGAGDREALFLAAGEADAVLADLGVVGIGQILDHTERA
jgi:hypothetical protein